MKTAQACLLVVGVLFLSVQSAKAYDEDTHFYATYAMARYSGLSHESASLVALYAQWPDESPITVPTSVSLDPVHAAQEILVRWKIHFPSDRYTDKNWSRKELNHFGINLYTLTQPAHPLATQLLMQGMKRLSFRMAATSLHTLEDSFAHAGTGAIFGHATQWHWPDRPFGAFGNQQSIDKYKRMVRQVFKAMVAIRRLIPWQGANAKYVDWKLHFANGKRNYDASADELADHYLSAEFPAMATIDYDTLKDPEYKRAAIKFLLKKAEQAEFLNSSFKLQDWLSQIDLTNHQEDVYALMKRVIAMIFLQHPEDLNLEVALKNHGASSLDPYFGSFFDNDPTHQRREELIDRVTDELLTGYIPKTPDDFNKIEIEDDGEVRHKEMSIRITRIQKMIEQAFGDKVVFVGRLTGANNRCRDMDANTRRLYSGGDSKVKLVAMTCQEQDLWEEAIGGYIGKVDGDFLKLIADPELLIPSPDAMYYESYGCKSANASKPCDVFSQMIEKGQIGALQPGT